MDSDTIDAIVIVLDLIKGTDTSNWKGMEVRNIGIGDIGVNKEKTALYIIENGEWKRTLELYGEVSFSETYN